MEKRLPRECGVDIKIIKSLQALHTKNNQKCKQRDDFLHIMARTEPITFDEEILELEDDKIDREDIRKILEAERFIINASLPDIPFTGDLFKLYKYEISENATSEKELYYLNIRPECDIVRNGDPELYCLECEILDEKKINSEEENQVMFQNGNLIEKANIAYIPFINNSITTVRFKEIKVFHWNQELYAQNNACENRVFKQTRIGRVLPPFITKVQQNLHFICKDRVYLQYQKKHLRDNAQPLT